ncbi:CDGSH iron-sulfur domain-containing protein 3, mitochondrial [Balamuthia mandrillaris]
MASFDLKTRLPVVAQKSPFKVEVEAGKTYYWCTCGRSKNQPFCDGSHSAEETGMSPMAWTAPESKTVWLCGCKSTKKAPFCDGSHSKIPETVAIGEEFSFDS